MGVRKIENSWYANIWIAGDHNTAVEVVRKYCLENPLCVTITQTSFVYTGGMETGVCVRLINYPRFPKDVSSLEREAEKLAEFLKCNLSQQSYTIEYPNITIWYSDREQGV